MGYGNNLKRNYGAKEDVMSVELICKCDECRNEFYSDGETIYCSSCYDDLVKERDDLLAEVDDLKSQLETGD